MKMTGDNTLLALSHDAQISAPGHPGEAKALADLRQQGLAALREQGLDLRGKEEWKYADLEDLAAGRFSPYEPQGDEECAAIAGDLLGAVRLVFLNGVYLPGSSKGSQWPAGVTCQLFSQMSEDAKFKEFGTLADINRSPFTAANTAFWTDGLFLEVADGVTLEEPIHLHFLTDNRLDGHMASTRNLVRLGKNAGATVIEHYHGLDDSQGLALPVTEYICAEGADGRHLKLVDEAPAMQHLGSTHVSQAAASRYTSVEFALNGGMIRRELHLDMTGEGASCHLFALSMGHNSERRDMRTRVDHSMPNCVTEEVYKGIYNDRSHGIFDGRILVARDAQKTSAHQTNRNLLLDDDAVSNSVPRLEIYADDVKCSHGSTTGRLDDEAIFFLRTRGFDATTARVMLARAFAGEIIAEVRDKDVNEMLVTAITERLQTDIGGRSA